MKPGKDFIINEDVSITWHQPRAPRQTPEMAALDKEYADLDYLLNNHPDRLSDVDKARKRRAELEKILGIDSQKSASALTAAQNKMRAKIMAQQKSGPRISDIIAQSKQHD